MAISNFDKKLEILSFLIFLHGKLVKLSVILDQQGEDNTETRKREKEAQKVVDMLRGEMFRSWNGQAASVMRDLRQMNENAQRKVRELEKVADKVGKVAEILSVIDRAINLVSGL